MNKSLHPAAMDAALVVVYEPVQKHKVIPYIGVT